MCFPEDNIFRLPNQESKIYRIFSKKRILELIESNELVFVNPEKWEDPFENFFLKAGAVGPNGENIGFESIRKRWYGQCWTFNKDTDAMWRIYSPKNADGHYDGVRVETTIKKLLSMICPVKNEYAGLQYFAGAVEYWDRARLEAFLSKITFTDFAIGGQMTQFAQTLYIKREAFDHEQEVRFLFFDIHESIPDGEMCKFTIPATEMIDSIAIDPRLTNDEYKSISEELIKAGCTAPIEQSDLYKFDLRPIKFE
jgi:hypothetical protein